MTSLGSFPTEMESIKYLFVDTSEYIQLGVLDSSLQFEKYQFIEDNRCADKIHTFMKSILDDCNMKIANISGVFCTSGPGSYTGIRVAEGITNTLKWQGKKVYSLYTFEIPKMAGIGSGRWLSYAYKGELLMYRWSRDNTEKLLIKAEEYEHSAKDYSAYGMLMDNNTMSSRDILINNSRDIFSAVKSRNQHLAPYYYRPVEQEFNPIA